MQRGPLHRERVGDSAVIADDQTLDEGAVIRLRREVTTTAKDERLGNRRFGPIMALLDAAVFV